MVSVPWPSRLCVPAAVVMIHGLGCATVGPEVAVFALPAEAVTTTPAAAAFRNETSTEFVNAVVVPLVEQLMTSTPCAAAWWMAAVVSALLHEPLAAFGSTQQAW